MNNFYRDNTEGKERAKRPGTGFKSLVLIIIAIVPKMYGDLANKLILEAKRTQQLSQAGFNKQQLPVYQDELVRGILKRLDPSRRTWITYENSSLLIRITKSLNASTSLLCFRWKETKDVY